MSRTIEMEVFVAAPADVVWRAISDADQLARWFPVEARVEPGVGGSIWLSWGGGAEGTAPISHWEPNRHLGWTEARGAIKIAVDFHLEPRGEGTVVRLVHSGFGAGSEWDDEFHMTTGGWSYFLENLRWYVERHRDMPREMISFREVSSESRPAALAALTGPRGLGGIPIDELRPGCTYAVTAADGERISGTVLAASPATGQFGVTIAELGDALLFLEMEPHPAGARAGFWLSLYGQPPHVAARARNRFGGLYSRALGL